MNAARTIAIVDDDASVRRSLLPVVQSAGYVGGVDAPRADEPEAGGVGPEPPDHRLYQDEGGES